MASPVGEVAQDEGETSSEDIVIIRDMMDRVFSFVESLPRRERESLILNNFLLFDDIAKGTSSAAAHLSSSSRAGAKKDAAELKARAQRLQADLNRIRPHFLQGSTARQIQYRRGGRPLDDILLDLYEAIEEARENPTLAARPRRSLRSLRRRRR